MNPIDEMLAEECADTIASARHNRLSLAEKVAEKHPALFYRVRVACGPECLTGFDRDYHAALICRDVLDARRFVRIPYAHLSKARA